MKKNILLALCSMVYLHTIAIYAREQPFKATLDTETYHKMGRLIWRNECAQSIEKLTWWNNGEEFASLGIGHFIWYPTHEKIMFTQAFPTLLNYLHKNNVTLPAWLGTAPTFIPCPWNTREEFFTAFSSTTMLELRSILSLTIDLQTKFIITQTEKTLNNLIAKSSTKNKSLIRKLIHQMQQSPNGLYALIDYINFKGEGTNPNERYQLKGWGLLQVLEIMHNKNTSIVQDFADAAKKILIQRVEKSPAHRNEQKFLAGWINRINTYTQPL